MVSGESSAAQKPEGPQVRLEVDGDAAFVSVIGVIDDKFAGFGELPSGVSTLVIQLSSIERITSFGVRQWTKNMKVLPESLANVYLVDCPTYFVDHLNMVRNFGGTAKVLTVHASNVCRSCDLESTNFLVDVVADRAKLIGGMGPDARCPKCDGSLEFEAPEAYFRFMNLYGATSVSQGARRILERYGSSPKPMFVSVDDIQAASIPRPQTTARGSGVPPTGTASTTPPTTTIAAAEPAPRPSRPSVPPSRSMTMRPRSSPAATSTSSSGMVKGAVLVGIALVIAVLVYLVALR